MYNNEMCEKQCKDLNQRFHKKRLYTENLIKEAAKCFINIDQKECFNRTCLKP